MLRKSFSKLVAGFLVIAAAGVSAAESPLLALRLSGDRGEYDLRIEGVALLERELTITCIEGCDQTFREPFADYPISVIRPADGLNGFCVLATTGSAYALHCYSLGDRIEESVEQGLRSVVSISPESVVVLDGEWKQVVIPWSKIEGG